MNENNKSVVLPPEAIKEFQTLYEKACGEKLNFEQAEAEGLNLLELFVFLQK